MPNMLYCMRYAQGHIRHYFSTHSIYRQILSVQSLEMEEVAMTNTFWVWLSEQGQALSIALLAFLFGGALLLGYL